MSDIEKIQLFESKKIRTVWVEKEEKWYFAIEDVVEALTESRDPKQYVKRMKLRDPELAKGWVQIVPLLTIMTEGGPQKMRCANLEGMFRINRIRNQLDGWARRPWPSYYSVTGRTDCP